MKSKVLIFFIILGAMLSLDSCSVKKFIPEGEKLYNGGNLKVNSKKGASDISDIETELNNLLRPKPNSRFLGARIGLWYHYKAQKEKSGFIINYFDKKFGEKPVYLSNLDINRTTNLVYNRLENSGYFNSEVTSEISERKYSGNSLFNVVVQQPYILKSYSMEIDSLPIHDVIAKSLNETLIKKGSRFDLNLLKNERIRIDNYAKAEGYYNFNADFLIFEADTNGHEDKGFDLYLRLKKDVPLKSVVPYVIRNINVFPNYSSLSDTSIIATTDKSGINFFQDTVFFKNHRLKPFILFIPNHHYNPQKSRWTSNRLSSIGTYKYVNIRFEETEPESIADGLGVLNVNIYLSPRKKRAIRFELQAVSKSNNFIGPALSSTYSNRNLFQGGELLNITAKLGYETQLSGKSFNGLSSSQVGLKTDLIFPRLLLPFFNQQGKFKYGVPRTKITLGWEALNRSNLYNLSTFIGSFGYSLRGNSYVFHELDVLTVNYVRLSNSTPEFETILADNAFLRSSFEQQFIAGIIYTFTYSELSDSERRNPLYLTTNIDIAGNALNMLSRNVNTEGNNTFLGLEFAQYAKVSMDFRWHATVGKAGKLIPRLFAGFGKPYGNSQVLPFSKQFFAGGPYSVRAFRIRSLGPGTYDPEEDNTETFFDQTGDIRLEANLEYRFPLMYYLKGALFIDAGNVWLSQENEEIPGGKFTNNFINELGIGTGFGVRLDIQNFVIRLDLAFPTNKPTLLGNKFDFDYKNPVFNFAIGYPF